MLDMRLIAMFATVCAAGCTEETRALSLLQRTATAHVASRVRVREDPDATHSDGTHLVDGYYPVKSLEEIATFQRQTDEMDLISTFDILKNNLYSAMASRTHKLFFCTMLKNAATEFTSLMMRVEGSTDTHWNPGRHGEPEDTVHNDPIKDALLFNRSDILSISELKGIYTGSSPGWTRAVVLRDPVERLVSAWESKVRFQPMFKDLNQGGIWKKTTQEPLEASAGDNPTVIPFETSFEDMVQLLEDFGDLSKSDPHLKLQSQQCGLAEPGNLELFDIIGNMDSIATDSREMLTTAVGSEFADEMLNTGWGSAGELPLFDISRSKRESGNGDAMESGGTKGFIKKMSPDLVARVKILYAADFELIEMANSINAKRHALA